MTSSRVGPKAQSTDGGFFKDSSDIPLDDDIQVGNRQMKIGASASPQDAFPRELLALCGSLLLLGL